MTTLPGVPLHSGFGNWVPSEQMRLSPEARQRVADKIADVERARRQAMAHWHEAVIG